MNWQELLKLAMQHHRSGRLRDAEPLYRQVLAQHPENPDALHLLGVVLHQNGRSGDALPLIERVARAHPDISDIQNSLGECYRALGQLDQAVECINRSVALDASNAPAWSNLSAALRSLGRFEQAATAARRAIDLSPNFVPAIIHLGNALLGAEQFEEAAAAYRRALALRPDSLDALTNLGAALKFLDQLDEATEVLWRAARLSHVGHPEIHHNLGTVLHAQGRLREAIAEYDRAISLRPDYPCAKLNRAISILLSGDLPRGFAEYEARWHCRDFKSPVRSFKQPKWTGEDIVGKTILLHGEQGFGDTIQFARYAPLVAERGARVLFLVQPQLVSLLRTVPGVSDVIAEGEALPPFDVQAAMLSLPVIFNTTVDSIPASVPCVSADPTRVKFWRERLARDGDPFRVGIAWRGNPHNPVNRSRSIPPQLLSPLADVKGVRLYSLQMPAEKESSFETDFTADLNDFADTAALMMNLDLIITVCTSTAHLAGALGRPTWTLLSASACWRWMCDREDSPWYPTMRLFRQGKLGDWNSLVKQVRDELAQVSARKIR